MIKLKIRVDTRINIRDTLYRKVVTIKSLKVGSDGFEPPKA